MVERGVALPRLLEAILARAGTHGATPMRFFDRDGTAEITSLDDVVADALELAGALRSLGLAPRERVAIRGCGASRRVSSAILGTMLAGMVAVPIVHLLGDAETEQILDLSRASALLSEAVPPAGSALAHLERLASDRPALRVVILDLDTAPGACVTLGRGGSADMTGTIPPGDSAVILFTSGSTSVPKGVVHSYESLMAETYDFADQLCLRDEGRLLQLFPLGHIGGLAGLLVSSVFGREVNMLRAWSASLALEVIDTFGVTSSGSTPYLATTLFDERDRRGRGLESLRIMECGGSRVDAALVERADRLGIALFRAYGSTEHPTATAHRPGAPLLERATSDGLPTNGSQVRVLDQAGHVLPQGVEGEVALRGPEQFLGYFGDADARQGDGWFRTGDIGYLSESGHLFVTGRIKEIIIRGGENISIQEVESALTSDQSVVDAAVVAVPDDKYGERAFAFVVMREPGRGLDLASVRAHFAELGMAKFKVPEWVEAVSELPRTGLGKVDRRILRQKAAAMRRPQSSTERGDLPANSTTM